MRPAYVESPSYALGELSYTVGETAALGKLISDPVALARAGFAKHHVCAPRTTAYDLARAAVEPIAGALGQLDAIIYATCIPSNGNIGDPERYRESRDVKHLMDYPASRLQAEFRQERAQVLGLNQQACTSMLGSLRLARALIATEPEMERILCITADRFPDGALYEQAYNLISDGAAAVIVSSEPRGLRILACDQLTNGALALASDDETVGSYFSYTHRLIMQTLGKAKLTPAQVDWVVPQNTNLTAWQILARMLGIDFARVHCPTLPECGHMISGDNVVNLKSLLDSGQVRAGDRLLLFMAGYGMNWQCVVLEAV